MALSSNRPGVSPAAAVAAWAALGALSGVLGNAGLTLEHAVKTLHPPNLKPPTLNNNPCYTQPSNCVSSFSLCGMVVVSSVSSACIALRARRGVGFGLSVRRPRFVAAHRPR